MIWNTPHVHEVLLGAFLPLPGGRYAPLPPAARPAVPGGLYGSLEGWFLRYTVGAGGAYKEGFFASSSGGGAGGDSEASRLGSSVETMVSIAEQPTVPLYREGDFKPHPV